MRERKRLWTLRELADALGITPDSLRQRIHRGTLKAAKAGRDWLVADGEAKRVIAAREAEIERINLRAREIVANRDGRKRQPSGVDQHGGRA